MRTTSFILAFAFMLAGPSMAGSSTRFPGVGTFAYNGSPVAPRLPADGCGGQVTVAKKT